MSETSKPGAAFAPSAEANLPSITVNMLIDFLSQEEILHKPTSARRSFRWLAAVSRESVSCALPVDIADAHLLFVCGEDEAATLLEEKPTAFALVLVDEEHALPSEAIERFPERLIAIRQRDRFSYFVFQLQSYFTQLLVWENELDRIATRQGSLNDALNATTMVVHNFIFISDSNFNVIARSTMLEPPDELHRHIVETGCLTLQMIEEKRQRLPEKGYYIKPPSALTPYARLSRPLYINHTYFGSLSMSCHTAPLTNGLEDLFDILVRHIMPLCEAQWRAQVKLNVPQYFFFAKMLEHAQVTDEYLHSQMEAAHLTEDMEFKLIVMNVDGEAEPERAAAATQAALRINQGSVSCFSYQDVTLVLCYAPPSDSRLSHIKTIEDLRKHIYEPLGVESGVSEVFVDITNLDLAYRQAKIALGLKHTLEQEQFSFTQSESKGIYLFGDALLYFLVDPSNKDARFMRFCFQHTILEKLYAEDQQNGTNCLALFWFYLYYGRNATAVAQRLHMHRNTVLYHVEKIQKRFDFDLSWRSARDRMMLDFRVLFLTMSHESVEKIFADVQEDSANKE